MPRVYADINPAMLVWAREERGFSVEEAAKKISLSAEKLKSSEAGLEKLTFPQLRKAAYVYRRPTAIFYLETIPKSLEIPEFRRLPGYEEEGISPELRLEIRKIQQKKKAAVELKEYGPDFNWDFVGAKDTNESPEVVSHEIRAMLDIANDFPKRGDYYGAFNHWRDSIEHLGVLVFLFRGVAVEEARGLNFAEAPYPVIAVSRSDPPQARSFSLLHEFCHILLEDSTLCQIQFGLIDENTDALHFERYCNHVAGATLVPAKLLLNLDIVESHETGRIWNDEELISIARRFCVSREVILRRLLILKQTSHEFYSSKRREWQRPTAEKRKPGGFGQSGHRLAIQVQGATFTNLVINAHENHAITTGQLSELLGMKLRHLPALKELVEDRGM